MVFMLILITLVIAVTLEIIISKSRKMAPESAAVPIFNKSNLYAPQGFYFSNINEPRRCKHRGILEL